MEASWSQESEPLLPHAQQPTHKTIDVILVGTAFFFLFSARMVALGLASSVLAVPQVAFTMIGIMFISFAAGNLLAASATVDWLGTRASLCIGSLLTIALNAGLAAAIFPRLSEYTQYLIVVPCAVVSGVGASILWTAQGVFIRRRSSTANFTRFSGMFFAIVGTAGIFGPLLVSTLLRNRVEKLAVFEDLLVVGLLSPLVLLLVWRYTNESPMEVDRQLPILTESGATHISIFNTITSKRMMLLVPLFYVNALNQAFANGSLPLLVKTMDASEDLSVKCMLKAVQACVEVLVSLGIMGKLFGTNSPSSSSWIMGVPCVMHSACQIALVFLEPMNNLTLLFLTSCSLGVCDSIFNSQAQVLVGTLFPKSIASKAYASYKFHVAIGNALFMFLSPLMLSSDNTPNMDLWGPMFILGTAVAWTGVYIVSREETGCSEESVVEE